MAASPSASTWWQAGNGSPDRRREKRLCELSLQASLPILPGGLRIRNHACDTLEHSRHMAYVIAEPCIGTKDTACVDACPVDCIHPKKEDPRSPTLRCSTSIRWNVSIAVRAFRFVPFQRSLRSTICPRSGTSSRRRTPITSGGNSRWAITAPSSRGSERIDPQSQR